MRPVWQIMGAAGILAIALSPVTAAAQLEARYSDEYLERMIRAKGNHPPVEPEGQG